MKNKQRSETFKSGKKTSDLLLRRPYSFMLEYGSMSIIKRWLIRAKERSKKSGAPFVVIKSYIHFRL
ncbi:unnamed protein product [Acanthoscelides obtectus]|uniref:Uncharacterized protein n=1 Tax=Acanthoscelides obtectus TaxID=200917 RepID=A0A9P0PS38_ACAOB|nr:unnamed protein product [Acanthoscelides obtectus]CAK1632884.1 hypothetical protein AOBTE_LOCUS7790 [Acanthoscelides obtectus]